MEVDQVGKMKTYEFLCNTCYSMLRAKEDELLSSGLPKVLKYQCPVCKKQRYVETMRLQEVTDEEPSEGEQESVSSEYLFNRRNNIS